MKKAVLGIIIVFAMFIGNANVTTVFVDRNCVEEAMIEGDKAQEDGANDQEAYDKADLAYLRCEADKG